MRLLLKRDGMMLIWKNGHNGGKSLVPENYRHQISGCGMPAGID